MWIFEFEEFFEKKFKVMELLEEVLMSVIVICDVVRSERDEV